MKKAVLFVNKKNQKSFLIFLAVGVPTRLPPSSWRTVVKQSIASRPQLGASVPLGTARFLSTIRTNSATGTTAFTRRTASDGGSNISIRSNGHRTRTACGHASPPPAIAPSAVHAASPSAQSAPALRPAALSVSGCAPLSPLSLRAGHEAC